MRSSRCSRWSRCIGFDRRPRRCSACKPPRWRSGAIPVYMLAMRRLRNPIFATVFAATFLLHPALGRTNLENYHPDSFLIPILGFAIYAAVENRPRLFVVCSVLALLCKEDVVLVLLPLALWYAWRHNRRVGGHRRRRLGVGRVRRDGRRHEVIGRRVDAQRVPVAVQRVRSCVLVDAPRQRLPEGVRHPARARRAVSARRRPAERPAVLRVADARADGSRVPRCTRARADDSPGVRGERVQHRRASSTRSRFTIRWCCSRRSRWGPSTP